MAVGCYTRWFDDVLRARTVARKRRKRSELPCSLGFRTLNHSIRKSLLKAVGNAKEEHANTRGVRESVSLLKRKSSLSRSLFLSGLSSEKDGERFTTL